MIRVPIFILVICHTSIANAQTYCAPGACWAYYTNLGGGAYKRHHYQYVGDTLVNGITHQRVDARSRDYYPWGISDWPDFTELIRTEGAAVLSDHSNMTWNTNSEWDTIQYFGNIGDRWWPPNADENCPPQGMLQITDTGHVVFDALPLRTWQMAYLDINGIPMMTANWPLAPFTVTERIGTWPRMPHVYMCGITEAVDVQLLAYMDADITFAQGAVCDLPMAMQANMDPESITLHPNPGTDQLWITGLSANASIEVRDPLGRLVRSRATLATNTPIETASWESGTYFIMIADVSGTQRALRWVKQ